MKRIGIALLVLLLIPALMKSYILAENAYLRRQDAGKLHGAVSGWYSLIGPAPERIAHLLSPESRSRGEELLGANGYESLCSASESYAAYEIELHLENRSDVDLYGLSAYAVDGDVYVDNGYLICDKPLLPGNTSDVSHDQTWLIVKEPFDIENAPRIRIEGHTQHGYSIIWDVAKK